jgi:hypothetical protein
MLCAHGHSLGSDVRRYLFHYKGYAYSTWELTKDRIPMQVEVPVGFTCIRQLLHSVEWGLRLECPGGKFRHASVGEYRVEGYVDASRGVVNDRMIPGKEP